MAESQTKIAQELTPEELAEFCNALLGVPHEQMAARIQAMAAERGISIGKSAAYEFRNKEALPWIKRIQERKAKAAMLAEISADGDASGQTLADAAAAELSQRTFDFLSDVDNEIDLGSKEGQKLFATLTKGVAALRSGDREMIKQLQERLEAAEKREKETKADLNNRALSEDERSARMRARFGV